MRTFINLISRFSQNPVCFLIAKSFEIKRLILIFFIFFPFANLIYSQSPVWVNDDWSGTLNGTDLSALVTNPVTQPPGTVIYGTNAFADLSDGYNAVASGGTVYIHDGTYYENMTINKNVTFDGESTIGTLIDGNDAGRVFYINGNFDVQLHFVTIRNGMSGDGAGINCTNGNLTMTYCNISDNYWNGGSNRSGTGLYAFGSILDINYCTFSNNSFSFTGDCYGGGIRSINCNIAISNSTINSNTARFGSGFYISGSSANQAIIDNCVITNNNGSNWNSPPNIWGYGGGGLIQNVTCIITNTTISNNSTGVGGALDIHWCDCQIIGSSIYNNSATHYGALHVNDCSLNIINSTISANFASTNGSAYYGYNGTV